MFKILAEIRKKRQIAYKGTINKNDSNEKSEDSNILSSTGRREIRFNSNSHPS